MKRIIDIIELVVAEAAALLWAVDDMDVEWIHCRVNDDYPGL